MITDISRPDKRIPVYLLTGYLGSGKTSLLKNWLQQDALAGAALIINELGEVGLDNQLLSTATPFSALVANACACCTGLPGLSEAMEDLFWARLERRVHRFTSLVIETTGLADPAPIVQTMADNPLLHERYNLAGVITCVSATTAHDILTHFEEARLQLAGADVVILTKTDLLQSEALTALTVRLEHQLQHLGGCNQLQFSAQANYPAERMLQDLKKQQHQGRHRAQSIDGHAHVHDSHHSGHAHLAQAFWWPMPQDIPEDLLRQQLGQLHSVLSHQLLRVKGRVRTAQGPRILHMAPFDPEVHIEVDLLPASTSQAFGLTVIVASTLTQAQRSELERVVRPRTL